MDLHAGESFRSDAAEQGRYFLTREVAADSWDQWNEARDQMAADAASQNTGVRNGYAGTQGYGWSDLDANGQWYDVPGQGQVWQPAGGDAEDFDPYDNGSWVWYPSVWASGYAWGWTPFRCGGWSYWNGFGWGWVPNGGCGGFGFAGFGYGNYGGYRGRLNVILPPRHYNGHHFPLPGRDGAHPTVLVHTAPLQRNPHSGSPAVSAEPRVIAGVIAQPRHPIGTSYTARGASAVGASLRRDFPVNQATQSPVLGVQAGQGAVRQGFVSGAQPVRTYTPNVQRSIPYGAAHGPYPTQGAAIPQTYTRPIPQQSAPRVLSSSPPSPSRMAAPPPAPARASSAPPASSGGAKR